jgi:site-specific DNA recombinase
MPDLRARETNLRNQIHALDTQLADREAYLALAADLHGFLTQLHARAETSTPDERRRVLKLLVKDVLIGPEKITIRHRIPLRDASPATPHTPATPTRRVNIPNIAQPPSFTGVEVSGRHAGA